MLLAGRFGLLLLLRDSGCFRWHDGVSIQRLVIDPQVVILLKILLQVQISVGIMLVIVNMGRW